MYASTALYKLQAVYNCLHQPEKSLMLADQIFLFQYILVQNLSCIFGRFNILDFGSELQKQRRKKKTLTSTIQKVDVHVMLDVALYYSSEGIEL